MKSYRVTKSSLRSSGKRPKGLQQKKAPPRQDSPNANDPRNRTSYHPDQAHWSWEDLPDILYQLSPDDDERRLKDPGLMKYPIHGKYLRNFPVLPDNISSTVEEFRVEAWQRIDARICLEDITARMHPDFRIKNNALQQRGVRFRQAFNLKAWRSGNKRSAQLEADLLRRMEELGLDINSNSTRGITPGLVNPQLGEEGGRVPIPKGWRIRKMGNNKSTANNDTAFEEQEVLSQDRESSFKASGYSETTLPGELEALSEDPEFLTQAPDVTEHETRAVEYVYQDVNDNEADKRSDNALPIIQGVIPDDELPDTVSLPELDLYVLPRSSHPFPWPPTPQVKQESDSLPLIHNQDGLGWRSTFWTPSSALNFHGFCLQDCFTNFPVQPEELLDYVPTLFANSPSKPQTPTTGIFPVNDPTLLDTVPERQQRNVFDDMLLEYYKGKRHVFEMPYHSYPSVTS
ncbi:hypothetical protein BDW71DRAFT_209742 [Aspergillus fruticulosus]